MLKLIMDIKCNTNPYYLITPLQFEATHFRRKSKAGISCERLCNNACRPVSFSGMSANNINKGPVAIKSANGLFGFVKKIKNNVNKRVKMYFYNIKHTYDHKVIFALVEKRLLGKNSIDSVTHDLDKLVLYSLGFSHSFVSNFHRRISEHHTESGKKLNLKSMLCDNIASSPEFKPEKHLSLREYYESNPELQKIEGFKSLLEKYNYGESLDFKAIKQAKKDRYNDAKDFNNKIYSKIF